MAPRGSLESVGIAFMLTGGMILRQVAVGRALNLRTDAHDFATAIFRGDTAGLSSVAARRGTNLVDPSTIPNASTAIAGPVTQGLQGAISGNISSANTAVSSEMVKLANAANNRYVWGAEGPSAYDCSGLVWRAVYNLGYYKGPRFTTVSFPNIAPQFATRVATPAAGDIVVWPRNPGHMGVVVGPDTMFSALNSRVGIVRSPISSIRGEAPQYWRLTMPATNSGRAF